MTRAEARIGARGGEPPAEAASDVRPYSLEQQVGFRLRQAAQRHHAIFARVMPADLTPRQWAVLAKLAECGPSPQNLLGRRTAMDAATIKGVVDRLCARDLIAIGSDVSDGRRRTISLTPAGLQRGKEMTEAAHRITQETLAPLTPQERETLMTLLAKIC